MDKFKVISVDMFQTLVDVNSRKYEVFKRILGDTYNKELAEDCWEEANRILEQCIDEYIIKSSNFHSIKAIFEHCYHELFPQKGILLEPKIGAEILCDEHGYSSLYNDTEKFINRVSEHFRLCLVSDTDYDMVIPLLQKLRFDKVFLSEEYQSYKHSKYRSIFEDVLTYYNIKPAEVLHIGDSYSDIAGANQLGIRTCWLNRSGRLWRHTLKPDYIVTSLFEVGETIGVNIDNK